MTRTGYRSVALGLTLIVLSLALVVTAFDATPTSAQMGFVSSWGGQQEELPDFGPVPTFSNELRSYTVHNSDDLNAIPADAKWIILSLSIDEDALCAKIATLKRLETFEARNSTALTIKVVNALAKCPSLRQVMIGSVSDLTSSPEGRKALSGLKGITYFDAYFAQSALPETFAALSDFSKLTVLKLYEFTSPLAAERPSQPAKGLSKLAALRELAIRGTTIQLDTMTEIAALPSLQSLDLSHSTLASGAESLLGILPHQVQSLTLSYVRFPSGSSFSLSESDLEKVANKPLRIKKLDLSSALIEDTNTGAAMMLSLERLATLEHLDYACYIDLSNDQSVVHSRVGPKSIAKLASLKEARVIRLDGHIVDADGLKAIAAGATKLESLSLAHCSPEELTPLALKELLSAPALKSLDLSFTNVGPAHAEVLATFPKLVEVSLADCKSFDDEACEKISTSPSITSVDLSRTPISGLGLKSLAKLTVLMRLNISGCLSCNPGTWPSMPKLEVLWLNDSGIKDGEFPTSSRLPKLEALSINDGGKIALTAKVVPNLAKFKNLAYLNISGLKPMEAHLSSLTELSKLEWLILGESGLTKANQPVPNILGKSGFRRLKRLDVRLFNDLDQDIDATGPMDYMKRMDLPKALETALTKRFPGVTIMVRREFRE